MIDVFYNERFIGTIEDKDNFIDNVRSERRKSKLPSSLNISYNEDINVIEMSTSTGRARRPLILVEEGKSKLTPEIFEKIKKGEIGWSKLIEDGIIEYLDASEEENTLVALTEEEITPEHTHLEISSLVILGITSSLVPYSHCGQSSRLNRGSKTQKQALGFYAANYSVRMDTDASVLCYPHTPIVRSIMHDIIDFDKHPSGQNITIALISYKGYNMSDGIIFNKGSIERGLARSIYFRPYSAEERRYSGGLMDDICMPDKEVKGYKSEEDYNLLDEDGIIYPGAKVNSEDIIIGKTSPPRFLDDLEEFSITANVRRESSVAVKHGEGGVVDSVFVTENEEGNKLVQVRVKDIRIPEVGDKFSSRYGQKGVVGAIIPEEDMPFTVSGIKPDLVFSPHGIPKRMTVSHLIEVLAGKVGALSGRRIDGTVFDAEPEERLRKELQELGFRENGTERMYNGQTGEEYTVQIFVGNMYYMRLKHMAANKLHARASGRIELLTRQPIEGRSQGGGLRLGEMEKDCLVAHGASLLLKERFDSDKTTLYICEGCGGLAVHDSYRKRRFCPGCKTNTEISRIEISYAFKLLLDELKAFGLNPKLKLESKY